ncbi:drug/metabolite transporter (DMT)-like permease [Croceifilum oryzae]|uniref:Drug/metabolite transporter (DMT)-like permease n=1 Tax=Croceifilum oryzae TaxID=1553429 RepID=A0AAJ1TGJ7_9BACL|nr:DMT family transporter [Croceifilum oryzae]MDQ0418089.1 drug/metabolite transporter (DMT)-like permease [Croceifilum oryzae]
MSRIKASILVLIAGISYGFISLFVKLAYAKGYSPAQVSGSQVFFGVIGMWYLAYRVRLEWRKKQISRKDLISLLLGGAFSAITGVTYYLCLQTTPASFAIILMFQFTWMGMLIECVKSRRKPTKDELISIVVILLGTFLAAGISAEELSNLSGIGVFYGLLSAIGYTGFIYFNGTLAPTVHPTLRGAWMITGTLIAIFGVYPPTFLVDGTLLDGLWAWGLLLGLFGSLIPSYLFAIGIPHIGSGMASILGSVELPVVILTSALLLSESVSMIQWVGTILILVGIGFSELRRASSEKKMKLVE